jgi:CubicO group peptidase (beta-lactamase class C family)
VVPLDDQFSLYLVVWRDTTGELRGAFRNPERNSRGGASWFHVVHEADSVRFRARPDTSAPEIRLAAAFDTTRKQLTLWWPDLERPLVLTPRTTEQAVGLYPRVPRGQRYHYRVPPPEADGWTTARAAAVGFDEAALERLIQRIVDTEPTGPRAPLIHSLLVARHGRLVLEEYFFGFARARPHDTRSAAKTFASVMLGAAILQGRAVALETPVYALMKREGAVSHPDPRKQRITVAHLLTHSSGLACDDGDDASPGNENTMQAQTDQPDWWTYTLDLPMGTDPGTHYAYCSGGMNLVGGALTAATGEWLPELFDRTLARPLEFGAYYYNLMPTLEGYAGGGVQLLPRDLLKVGQAYLDGGVWRGRRIVAAVWVARSTARQIDGPYGPDGFAWHLNTLHPGGGDRDYREYEANGNGGQLLIVLPELDLAVVFTAGNYMSGGVWTKFRNELVPQGIIAAIGAH